MQILEQISIFKVGAKPVQAFTAATTNIITSNAHGLSEGDCVILTTTATLPAGLSLATNYYVISPTTNTFKLSATPNGSEVDITNTGTGTHTYTLQGKAIFVKDIQHIQLDFYTANNANLTIKVLASNQPDVDFNKAQSSTNRWDYIEVFDKEDDSAIDGDTGVTLSGTDDNRSFEINNNHSTLITVQLTAYSAGNLNVIASGASY